MGVEVGVGERELCSGKTLFEIKRNVFIFFMSIKSVKKREFPDNQYENKYTLLKKF